MLMGMADDPDWVKDMVNTYAQLTIDLFEILFSEEGYPDGIWFYEDMGYKQHPFMSPRMYREIIQPGHALTIQWAKSKGLPVIMHSCGYVEPLVPGMIEAGIDCLQVIEVKAGMDLLRLYQNFGEQLSFMGGIDVRVLYNNDRAEIDAELEAKIPIVKGNVRLRPAQRSFHPQQCHARHLSIFHRQGYSARLLRITTQEKTT